MRRSAGGAQHGRFAMSAGGHESPGRALRTTSAHHAGDCADPSPLWPPDRAPTRRALRNDDSAAAPPPQARSGRAAPLTTSRAAAPRGSAGWAPPGRRVRRTGVYARLRLIPRDTALHSRAPRRARRRLRPLRSGPPERAQPWARALERESARPRVHPGGMSSTTLAPAPMRGGRRRGAGPLRLDFFKRLPVHIYGAQDPPRPRSISVRPAAEIDQPPAIG